MRAALSSLRRCGLCLRCRFLARRRPGYWLAVILLAACTFLYLTWYSIAFALFGTLVPLRENDAQLWTCPTCYGNDYCRKIGEVHMEPPSLDQYFMLGVKGVTFARRGIPTGDEEDEEEIVVKALGSKAELKQLDGEICKLANRRRASVCQDSSAGQAALSVAAKLLPRGGGQQDYLSSLAALVRDYHRPNIGYCPLPRLWEKLDILYDVNSDGRLTAGEAAILLTQMTVNGEVVLFKAFPSREGWPFPVLLGTCGRLVFEEQCGRPISKYLGRPWSERVRLALSLLEAVLTLSENEQRYIFQLLDLTMDNFVLAENGVTVKLIDGEHVLVVDVAKETLMQREKLTGTVQPREAENTSCLDSEPECQSFDIDAMCQGHSRDHNYLYTCKNVLLGHFHRIHDTVLEWDGLLHSPPDYLLHRLAYLLQRCVFGGKDHVRAEAFHDIIRVLQEEPSEIVHTS